MFALDLHCSRNRKGMRCTDIQTNRASRTPGKRQRENKAPLSHHQPANCQPVLKLRLRLEQHQAVPVLDPWNSPRSDASARSRSSFRAHEVGESP